MPILKKPTRPAILAAVTLAGVVLVSALLSGAAAAQGRGALLVPSISLEKTVSSTPGVCGGTASISVPPGTDVHYCYKVTNTGDVTFTNHTLVDDQLGTLLSDDLHFLPPGDSFTISVTVEITDDVTNLATWTADDGLAGEAEASDSAVVTVFDPNFSLAKTANTTPGVCPGVNSLLIIPGTPVNYCYRIINTGLVTLTHHTLVDNKLGLLIPLNTPITVPPGANYTFSTTEVITESVVNMGLWTVDDGFGHQLSKTDGAGVTVLMPAISLEKTVSAVPGICAPTNVVTVTAGSSVTYCYEIENTGQVTVTKHSLTDDVLGILFTDDAQTVGPGGAMVFSTTVVVNVDTVNTATWTAEEPFGNTAQDNDTATVNVTTPGVELIKTVTADLGNCLGAANSITVVPNTTVTYCFELVNTGTTTLTTHTLVDDHLGVLLSDDPIVIAPGGSHTLSVDELITTEVTNLATWTATDEFGADLETADTATVEIAGVDLELSKTVGTSLTTCAPTSVISVVAGTTVNYCFEITNTGVVTLTTHTLVDSELGLLLNGATIVVPPGNSYTYSETEVIEETVTNEAVWTATDANGNPAVSSDTATVNVVAPGILVTPLLLTSIQKSGEVTMATLYISNTGTTDLTWEVAENQVPGISPLNAGGGLGDTLFELDFGALLDNQVLLGIEFDGSSFWVTAGGVNNTAEPNLLYEFDRTGALLNTYTNTVDSAGFGWRDLAFDGAFLYASASAVIDEIDRTDGQPTGFTIPSPVSPARAIAYDPATDHFWVANFNSLIYEIDRDGLVVNSFPNPGASIYGLAWDDVSPGGPFLWAWTANNPPKAIQIDPGTGIATGVEFIGDPVPGGTGGGGAAITADLYAGRLVFLGMHQATNDTVIGYDLGVDTGLCAASDVSWLSILPMSGEIDPGSGVGATVVFDSAGLDFGVYKAHLCVTSSDANNPLVVVTVQMVVQSDFSIYIPLIFRDP